MTTGISAYDIYSETLLPTHNPLPAQTQQPAFTFFFILAARCKTHKTLHMYWPPDTLAHTPPRKMVFSTMSILTYLTEYPSLTGILFKMLA